MAAQRTEAQGVRNGVIRSGGDLISGKIFVPAVLLIHARCVFLLGKMEVMDGFPFFHKQNDHRWLGLCESNVSYLSIMLS